MSWANNNAAGNGRVTATGTGIYTGSASATFPIRWSTYTFSFHGNGSIGIPAIGTMSNQVFQYGVAQNLTTNAFSREGFTFAGWNTQPDGNGTAYTNGQSIIGLTTDDGAVIDLYAQWTVIPEVTVSNSDQTVCLGDSIEDMIITATNGTITSVTGLPAGVEWSGTTISGTPTVSGTFNVTVTVSSDQTPDCGTATATVTITVNPLPEVTVSNSSQIVCLGNSIETMEITATNATIANVEGLPAGVTWSGTMISGTPTESGTFNVTVMVDSYYGCGIGMAELTIIVNPLPEVTVTNNVQTICMDNQIQEMEIIYSNGKIESVTGLPENVNWSDTPSGATIFGAPAEYGTFNATVTVTSDQGCGTATADVTITVKPNPEVTVSNNFQTVCENSAITAMEITATHATIENVTGLPTGVSWSKDSSGATGTISGTPTASGTYNVTVTVNSDQTPSCGIAYAYVRITVNPLPEVTVTNNVQTICMDNQIQEMEIIYSNGKIESVTGLPENVNWSDTPSGATIFGAPAEYGTFNATVTVTSDQGCGTATADVTITVKPNPEVTVSNNFQTVCENSAITAMEITATHATIENVTGLPTGVSWSKDSSGATGTISGTPTASGTYNVTVTVNSDQTPSCGIAYAYVRITVNPLPEVTVTNDNQTVCAGDAIVAMEITATNGTIANVEGLPAGVTWSGTMISGTPTESGTFNVTVMVDSYYGCGIGMAELTIIVNPLPEAYTLDITGYGDSDGGWNLIASPLAESIAATEVGNLVAETADFDLYRFNQAANMEWENWKQEESEHYHFNLESGQGYLYASKEDVNLTFLGTPNSDDAVNVSLSYTEGKPLAGFNLVGNPFTVDAYVNRPFYKMNDAGTGIEAIENYNDYTTAQTIPACTGIVVKADNSGESVIFSTTAPSLSAPNNGNLQITLTQANTRGNALLDNAIVSFNEGSQLGKFYFGEQNGNIYIPQGGKEFAIAYSEGMGEMPLNFKARKNGEYTITVNPDNVEMSFLHLIDNLTGADVDLLQTPSYTFSARNDDYASRFKLVFKALGNSSETEEDFAFISNGEIIINGKGIVQVIDLMGRIILADEANRNISTKGFVSGVYVLRLIDGENAKTQKIVIQ